MAEPRQLIPPLGGQGAAIEPGPGLAPSFAEESVALAAGWRSLARAATFVAVATAPFFFLFLYFQVGWGVLPAILVTLAAVIVFRGLIDVFARHFIPWPSLFGDDGRMKENDISARRAAWYWQIKFRRITWLAAIYGVLVVIIYIGYALNDGISWWGAFTAAPNWISDQFTDPALRSQWVGLAISLPILFMVNILIFLGPLLYAGIKQIQAFEPGDADWGVRLNDVRGQEAPKEEVRKIVTLWQSGEAFERAGGKRERGILFLGPPGTGKTMLAKAIATGFNCPFVTIPGSAFAQTFIGVDVVLVMYLAWRARRLASKWGGQCIVFIDEIDAVGMRRQSLQHGMSAPSATPTIHDLCFYGPYGAINPSGDLILETRAWRDRIFDERRPPARPLYPAPIQAISDKIRHQMFPGMGGMGMGQGGLQQLLVTMDGVSAPKPSRRFLTNRINTFLDAMYLVPRRVKGTSLRLPPARPRKEELYFIGACNVPLSTLDPALTRPGRMGRHVQFRSPTKEDRKDIFDLYLAKVDHEPDLDTQKKREELARITMGHSPAMIEQVCSLALTYAAHDARVRFGWDDLVEAITTVEAGTANNFEYIPEESRATAIHEAGHAVTGHVYMKGYMSTRLTIRPRGGSGGHHALRETEERMFRWRSELFAELVWGLGAMAAERVFYGENTNGVGGDVMGVTTDAALMVGAAGMGPERVDLSDRIADPDERDAAEKRIVEKLERIGVQIMNRASGGSAMEADPVRGVLGDRDKRQMVIQLLGQAYVTAYWFVEHNKRAVERVADALEKRRELFGDEVVELLESLDLEKPDIDVLDDSVWPRI